MSRKVIPLAAVCVFAAIGLYAQGQPAQAPVPAAEPPANVDGNWTLIVHHPDPTKYFTEALTFHQDGNKFIGEFKRVWPVLKGDDNAMEGFINGNEISFDVWHHAATPYNINGNNSFTYYRGIIHGDTMSGTGNVFGEPTTWVAKKGIAGTFPDGKF
jgi:hypothetical protein